MGSGGGSGSSTSKTTTGPPAWLTPYAKLFLGEEASQIFPGVSLPGIGGLGIKGGAGGGGYPGIAGMPAGLNQQVAGFSPDQTNAMQMGENVSGAAQSLANLGAGTQGMYAAGGMMGPNPYLNQYYNQAANQDMQNYMLSTQPALQAQFQRAGAMDSSGFNEAQGLSQYGLGQSLATLGANIYEPAYQFESGQMLNAAQGMPGAIQGLYAPGQNLYNIGAAQQQQQQNQYNVATQNAQQQANWPFNMLSQMGGALGQAGMGAGNTISTGPPAQSGGK